MPESVAIASSEGRVMSCSTSSGVEPAYGIVIWMPGKRMSGKSSRGSSVVAMRPMSETAMNVISVVTGLRSANRVWIMTQPPPDSVATRGTTPAPVGWNFLRSSSE